MALQLASTGAYSAFNGYWSSSSGPDLGPYCDSGIQSVTLDLVRVLRAGPSTFTLSSDCWSEGILSNVSSSGQLVDRCLSLKDDIAYCQYKNIQVLVSVTVDDDQLDDAAGKDLAHLVYNSFGTYNNDWNGTRLFGQDVAVNGFNFNISPDFNSRTVLEMINQLRDLDDMLLIAGTSSCPLDSGNAKNHDTVKQLDALFLHYPQSSTCVGTDSATLDNFLAPQNWIQLLTGDKNTGAKLFISLPVSPWAAEADTSLTAKYASDIICKVKDDANFGGVSLWDDGKATSNENGDSVFYQQVLATRNQACSSETKSLDGESIKAESPSAHSLTSAKLVQRKVQQGPPVSNRWNLVEGSTPENQIWEAPPAIVRSCPPGGAICSQQRRVEYRSVTYYIPCRRDQKNARPRRETVTLAQRQSLEEELNQRIEQSLDTARNEYLRLFGERRQQQIAVWKNTLQREAFPAEIEEQNSLMKKADDIEMYRLMENYRRELDLWKARTLEEVARQEQELKNKRPAKRPNSQPVREAAQATSSSWLAQKTASTPLQAKKDFKMNKSSSRKPKVAATLKPESAVGRQQVATKTNTAKKVGAKTVISTNKARPASTKRPEAAKKVHKSYTKPEESRPKAQEASRVKPRPSRSTNLGIPIKKAKMDEVKNPEASTKNAKPSTWKKPDGPISNPRQSTLNKAETSSLSASTKSKASGQGPKPSSSRKAETSSIKPESRQSTEAATATKTQSSRQVTPSLSAFATKVSASRSTVSSKQDKVSTLKAQEPTLKAVSPSPSVSAEQIAVAKMDKVAMLKAFPSSRTSSVSLSRATPRPVSAWKATSVAVEATLSTTRPLTTSMLDKTLDSAIVMSNGSESSNMLHPTTTGTSRSSSSTSDLQAVATSTRGSLSSVSSFQSSGTIVTNSRSSWSTSSLESTTAIIISKSRSSVSANSAQPTAVISTSSLESTTAIIISKSRSSVSANSAQPTAVISTGSLESTTAIISSSKSSLSGNSAQPTAVISTGSLESTTAIISSSKSSLRTSSLQSIASSTKGRISASTTSSLRPTYTSKAEFRLPSDRPVHQGGVASRLWQALVVDTSLVHVESEGRVTQVQPTDRLAEVQSTDGLIEVQASGSSVEATMMTVTNAGGKNVATPSAEAWRCAGGNCGNVSTKVKTGGKGDEDKPDVSEARGSKEKERADDSKRVAKVTEGGNGKQVGNVWVQSHDTLATLLDGKSVEAFGESKDDAQVACVGQECRGGKTGDIAECGRGQCAHGMPTGSQTTGTTMTASVTATAGTQTKCRGSAAHPASGSSDHHGIAASGNTNLAGSGASASHPVWQQTKAVEPRPLVAGASTVGVSVAAEMFLMVMMVMMVVVVVVV